MGKDSQIEWTHHTFNPWWGCVKVSAACKNCYAETHSNRFGGDHWGATSTRKFFGEKHWNNPLRWNRKAGELGEKHRVFCASMADVFEIHQNPEINALLDAERRRLFHLIEQTPNLIWLLLTKRPENWHLLDAREEWETLPNIWLGTTAENQEQADIRIPHLLEAPWPAVRFVSYEPALGPIELQHERGYLSPFKDTDASLNRTPRVDWVICGGERARKSRPMNEEWVRSIRDQCAEAGAAFFYKQKITESGMKISLPKLDGVSHSEFPE